MPKKAKSTKQVKEKKDEVHVALYEPDSVRIPLLEAAKRSVRVMQREAKFEELRSIKLESFRELKAVLNEIMSLNIRLEKLLPKVKKDEMPTKKEALMYSEEEKAGSGKSQKTRFGELEMELADIEKRIGNLK